MEKTNIYKKLLSAQEEIGSIKKSEVNPFFKSKYFDINTILAEIKPTLNKQGLVLLQAINVLDGRTTLNTAIVDSVSGEKIDSNFSLTEITDPQKVGAGITYYRRFALQSLLALEAEDDDGNTASEAVKKPVTKEVKDFMKDLEPDEKEIIKWQELMEACRNLKELQQLWKEIPPMVQEKLSKVKDELKFKLV